ncbi:CBS domain-containing protein CBSX1, chloroplastic-like [Phalaenopsis equestris]|uniref:CBS domain-containing protein CBSX1, chloroplastic-like n=1 Tax=Phalaenopsis equestris TaxID=78828 RepID=UPI0009E50296|nr:CBS domain-containing protein CBSX1, chloroplastic-like [Phalaenopsis equestris]
MDSLISEALVVHQLGPVSPSLHPATSLVFSVRSVRPLSVPLLRRRFKGITPANPGKISASARNGVLVSNSEQSNNGVYSVADFMTKKEDLVVVKPSTSVDEALEKLARHRITGFPVIDDDWKLIGVVSDYDLLALDSISGPGRTDTSMFPEVNSTWKTFNELQKLLSKTNGKIVSEVMTPAPLVVHETTNLEDAARLLLETKFRRLPVVDDSGKLIGMITRGNVVRAALMMKHANEKSA